MKDKRGKLVVFLERCCVGIVAVSGLILAAALSGLPAANCAALGETYMLVVIDFGSAGFIALGSILVSGSSLTGSAKRDHIGSVFLSVVAIALFLVAMLSSATNLKTATPYCMTANDEQRRTEIPLIRYMNSLLDFL